jgi:hypothetical protein
MENDKFAVFILTHGRPDQVKTYQTLRNGGYTGDIYIIIDNEDSTADQYYDQYGDEVIMFDKAAIAQTFDEGDNFRDRRSVIYARNASFQIAEGLGLDYFLQLDDDYTSFVYKFDTHLQYKEQPVRKLDALFSIILEFYKLIPALTVAMGQNGDLIGGQYNHNVSKVQLKRKAMNTFFCSVEYPFQFSGKLNDDVNTYLLFGNRGGLMLTFFNTTIIQTQTQSNAGGLTDLYLKFGTYVKSFYSVMYAPSCVKIAEMGETHRRLHHRISWNNAVPKIINEKHCKRLHND